MNKNGTGGINMRGGLNPEYPLTQEQLDELRLNSSMHLLRIAAENTGGERLAENAWGAIMDICLKSDSHVRHASRLPDHDDAAILAAARTVSPDAVLTSGGLTNMVYGDDWMTEARALEADAQDLHNTQEDARL